MIGLRLKMSQCNSWLIKCLSLIKGMNLISPYYVKWKKVFVLSSIEKNNILDK